MTQTLRDIQAKDRQRIIGQMNAGSYTAVDQWFDNKLTDCRARRRAAIMKAAKEVGV